MNSTGKLRTPGHIVFDHDGTLVNTEVSPYTLFRGMREFLVDLKALGFELYIWTSRPRRSVLETIQRLDIASFFTDVFCYDDGIPKPNSMGLKKLTEGIAKNEIMHIGDSMTDIDGAQAFGIDAVAACWNDPDQVDKYKHIADHVALNLDELREIIKGKFHV